MVALNENFAPGKPALGSKNRVGNFFGRVAVRSGENRPATRNRIGENGLTLTIIASGRPNWPSRDPLGERGGVNLYGFVDNNPIIFADALGLIKEEDLPALESGINTLIWTYNNRNQIDQYAGAGTAAGIIRTGLLAAAAGLLSDRPYSLEYFQHFLSASGTAKTNLPALSYFNDANIKPLIKSEIVSVANTALSNGAGSGTVTGTISTGDIWPSDDDMRTTVGRSRMQYEAKTLCIEDDSGRLVTGVRAVIWVDEPYDFNNANFNLDDRLPTIPTRDIMGYLVEQGRAQVFQVQFKAWAKTFGSNDTQFNTNFGLLSSLEDLSADERDTYPDHSFGE